MTRIAFDDAIGSGGLLARLKLVGELAKIKAGLKASVAGPLAAVQRLRSISRANQIRMELGATQPKAPAPAPLSAPDTAPEDAPLTPRNPTAQFYEFDPNRRQAQRKKDNAAAIALLARIDAGELPADRLTDDERAVLAKYSGTGGALVGADGKKGSAYEYYTPKPIAEGVWDLMAELGFSGGKVLDPCAGVGIFGATAPATAAIDAVELNETSGRINGLVNAGPGYTATVSPFERVAAGTPDEEYDAVVTNVPFGGVADRGGNQLLDDRYQKEPLQNYFILRSLEKLKPGGLAVFITPPRCVSGKGGKEEELRIKASYMAEFLGAYRLPNSVFGTASADTMTDVIAFRKYGRDVLEKIGELREQSPQTLLDANVQWTPFIAGHYFEGDGRRFVLGEFVPKNPDKFRDVDRVINPASVAEIGRMLKRFPDSRVNWDLLGTTETAPIVYADGDTITQAGQTLLMQDGRWMPLKRSEDSAEVAGLIGKLTDPYSAFENRITLAEAENCVDFMVSTAQALDIPDWLRGALADIRRLADQGARAQYWNAGIVGMAVAQVLAERLGEETGVKFIDEYPALSDAMQRVSATAKKRPGALGGKVREGLATIGNHYNRKDGFSAVWRGDVLHQATTVEVTADASFEGLRYKSKSAWVPIDDAKAVFGDAFDPIGDAAWCISADGRSVTRSDDYYVGNYAEFLARADAEIAAATDDTIRAKLLRQKIDAEQRVDRVDASALTYSLFSPLVTLEEKAEFLRRFVHPSASVVYDEATGEKRVDIDVPGSKLTDREKLLNRIGDYLKNGTITLGGAKLSMPDAAALHELRKMVNTANEQFNGWVRGNAAITQRIECIASDPTKARFRQVEDEAPLTIQGMNPALTLHGYQNAFVRAQGREFGGINGHGVGLGKTFEALAAVQYVQSIGVKKKTLFVVPNSVLSKWRKEASRAYVSTDDCLFVGLREGKDGEAAVNSANYDADLTVIMENRHAKIFMTMEAFERLRMRDETISKFEQYMRAVDASFAESEDKKADERAKGKQAGLLSVLQSKSGSAPFIEDLGIDSLVMDEAHVFKNSAETVDFKAAKFLSLSPASKRGIDAQAKAWYVRGLSPQGDGVLPLTATPITNSPLEMYAMLTLAVGHERVNDLFLGIKGADQFMNLVCVKTNIDDVSIDGVARTTDVFVGLDNVGLIRKAIASIASIKSAADVGGQIVVPERDECASPITLPRDISERLKLYKGAFRFALDTISKAKENRGSEKAFEIVSQHFGEDMDLIAHPFNLINKMTMLIADPELDQRATYYSFIPAQSGLAVEAVDKFNARRIVEERPRPSPLTEETAIVGRKVTKDISGESREVLKIEVRARIVEGRRIAIDAIDPSIQTAFENIAEKIGLDLDVSVPPKLAAMLENFQNEQAAPRGIDDAGKLSPIVKQIIFCDILPLHNKIKRLLSKRAGVPAGAIAFITGKTNSKPEEILAVQDGFNAFGEANRYRAVIANEKAEVGIDLQRGTQATHHLTIGWTPDSLEQRNGRGARQGNQTAFMRVYYYDADGTFDTSKRAMVSKKADWIGQVMDVNGGNSVAVTGGLSREQMEALIDVVGDADAMQRMQESISAKEEQVRAASNRDRQMINVDTIRKQRAFLAENPSATQFIIAKIVAYWNLQTQTDSLRMRIANPSATTSAVDKNKALLAEIEGRVAELRGQIERSATIFTNEYRSGGMLKEASSLDAFFTVVRRQSKVKQGDIEDMLKGKKYPSFSVEPIEGGPITSDWQSEVDMANSMIKEAQAAFTRQAAEEGAYPALVIDAIAAGRGAVISGRPVVTGAFVRSATGLLGVVDIGEKVVRFIDRTGRETTQAVSRAGAGDLILPGSAEYDACVSEAAEIEDAIAATGAVQNGFNALVPEVAQRRKEEVLASYRAADFMLPAPYFPYVMLPSEAARSIVKGSIAKAQAVIVKAFTSDGRFVVPGHTAVLERPGGTNEAYFEALRDFAVANNLTLDTSDLGFADGLVNKEVARKVSADELRALLTGNSEADIRAQADSAVREAVPWFDFGSRTPSQFLPFDYRAILASAVSTVKSPATAPSAAPPPATVFGDVVGIRGETFTHKNTIKLCADRAGDGKKKWDGDNKTWNVRRAAWDYLVKNYPSAAAHLELCPPTKAI